MNIKGAKIGQNICKNAKSVKMYTLISALTSPLPSVSAQQNMSLVLRSQQRKGEGDSKRIRDSTQ